MDMNRRQFFRVSGAGLAASSLVALGFSPTAALADPGGPPKCPTYGHPNCSTLAAVI